MEINPTVYKYKNMKKQNIQRMYFLHAHVSVFR